MTSAYVSEKQVVAVFINYTDTVQPVQLRISGKMRVMRMMKYVTSKDDDLKAYPVENSKSPIALPARSITTVVMER